MLWGAPLPERVGSPAALQPLLERALAVAPENGVLHSRLGYLHLDRKDHEAAAASFEAALAFGEDGAGFRLRLARCYNYLGRHAEALNVLAGEEPSFERGRALMELGDAEAAEREYRSVLAVDPDNAASCRMLSRLLRRSGRVAALVALCEELAARGASNAQLLYSWGWALALAGDRERARRLMFDPARVTSIELPVPAGFADIVEFNRALADEILENPNRVSGFPQEDEANRGSSRVEDLFSGRRPELIELLLGAFRRAAEVWQPQPADGFDPWPRLRPAAARLRAWGLIQRGGDYEDGHIHASGWLSGVYYVRLPRAVAEAPAPGPGAIEFGPPGAVAEASPDLAPARRYRPREGLLLLSPSFFQHRTIPSGVDEDRVSVAFDVVRDG